MTKLVIPSILGAAVLIAGIFAMMPVEKATTVHTTIQAKSVRFQTLDFSESTTAARDLTLTCPSTSQGCRILEIYVKDTSAGGGPTTIITQVNANVNGVAITPFVDFTDITLDNSQQALPQIGGTALGPSDTITVVNAGGTSTTYAYRAVVEVQGDQSVTGALGT